MKQKSWPRDPRLPYPLVYAVIEGKKLMEEHGGRKPTFTIMDIPEDRFEDVVDFMCQGFLDDEPLTSFTKLKEDPTSLKEFRHLWMQMVEYKCCLVAFADILDENGKPKIAGVNILKVKEINDTSDAIVLKGKHSKLVFEFMAKLEKKCDAYERYNVDKYLTALGLSVHRAYYGHGLGKQLLNARETLCRRALHCPLTVTVFSANNSQGLAASLNFDVLAELDYDKYTDQEGNYPFKDLAKKIKGSKYMAKKYV